MSAAARAACTCLLIMPDGIEEAFTSLGAGPGDIDLIIATDAEQILGIGEWGVGGIEVPIGKLAIYTAAGGIDPARGIAVMLDVGTNRESLLDDPTYIGNQHARIRGERYDAFIEAYVKAVTKLFPRAMLQFEDFAPGNGRRILEKYRDQVSHFQRRYAGHRRDHIGGGDFRRARLRDASAQPARGHFWSRYGGYRNRRPDSRRHGAGRAFERRCSQTLLVAWTNRDCSPRSWPVNCTIIKPRMRGRPPKARAGSMTCQETG